MAYMDDDETETKEKVEKPADLIEQSLFKSRTILLTGGINEKQARYVCERLLSMAAASDDPILLVISSPGGHVESGDMIHDMIRFIKPEVKVLGSGWVASAGVLIYLAAKKENRFCTPNTRFLLHQPSGGAGGKAVDIEIQAREIIKMRHRLDQLIARETGQTLERVSRDTERDYWMSAEEAIDYGIVTRITKNIADMR
ncbi:MAG TPA: ATP-dependent Clp protease proteolytic subunit [Alphaproteobacteria bacterium]|nr:ATP-dependent Clp protease proteolytic subunit [Alphaproteobacteria bacterium]